MSRATAGSVHLCRRQRSGQLLLRCSVMRLNVERGCTRSDSRGHDAGNLDFRRGIRDGRPALTGWQRHPLVANDEFDVSGRDEFDCRRDQRELALGPIDGCGGLVDLPRQVVGRVDRGQLRAMSSRSLNAASILAAAPPIAGSPRGGPIRRRCAELTRRAARQRQGLVACSTRRRPRR